MRNGALEIRVASPRTGVSFAYPIVLKKQGQSNARQAVAVRGRQPGHKVPCAAYGQPVPSRLLPEDLDARFPESRTSAFGRPVRSTMVPLLSSPGSPYSSESRGDRSRPDALLPSDRLEADLPSLSNRSPRTLGPLSFPSIFPSRGEHVGYEGVRAKTGA